MSDIETTRSCLVIGAGGAGPAADRADEAFEFLVEPALAACSLHAARVGTSEAPHPAAHALCIAILTGGDPAVYYRLAQVRAAGLAGIGLLEGDEAVMLAASELEVLRYRLTPSARKNKLHVDQLSARIGELLAGQARAPHAAGPRPARETGAAALFGHQRDEAPFIADAQQELWLVQETGSLLAERAKAELKQFLARGGRVHAAVTAPTQAVARAMALRNAELDEEAILSRAALASAHLRTLAGQLGDSAERLTVRYVPYPVGFTMTLADPAHAEPRRRRGLLRYAGFKTAFAEKLDLALTGEEQAAALQAFHAEARRLFLHASKLVLLVGPPRSGKTTLLSRIAAAQPPGQPLFTLLSPQQSEDGERTGFEYRASELPAAVPFATRQPAGNYKLLPGALNAALQHAAAAHEQGKVLLLDEIGPLQLSHPGFRQLVEALVRDPRVALIASLAEPASCKDAEARHFVERLLRHPRSTVLRLAPGGTNATEVGERIREELAASLLLQSQMPRASWGDPRPGAC